MILLTIAAGWFLVLSIVAGLCMSARRGDAELVREPASQAPSGPASRAGREHTGEILLAGATR
jgi:hypothetical protein